MMIGSIGQGLGQPDGEASALVSVRVIRIELGESGSQRCHEPDLVGG